MIILPEAEADIARAKAWYEDQQPGLGETFLGAVEDALARVSRMPECRPSSSAISATSRLAISRMPSTIESKAVRS